MKEFLNGYNEWVNEGKKKRYSVLLAWILIPFMVLLCIEYYYIGKKSGKLEANIDNLVKSIEDTNKNINQASDKCA